MGEAVVIHSGSKYVIELITYGSRSTTQIFMRAAKAFFDMHIVWIRGHTRDIGNDLADKHTGEAAEDNIDSETRWRPTDWGFTEFRRNHPIHFSSGKTTAKSVFEGAGLAEDAPTRKKTRRGSKRNTTRRSLTRRKPRAGRRTRSETSSPTLSRSSRLSRKRQQHADARNAGVTRSWRKITLR